jgi:hypothetical protein
MHEQREHGRHGQDAEQHLEAQDGPVAHAPHPDRRGGEDDAEGQRADEVRVLPADLPAGEVEDEVPDRDQAAITAQTVTTSGRSPAA